MATAFKQVKNNAKSRVVSGELNNTTASLAFDIDPGTGTKFPATAQGQFWVTAWNDSLYLDPGDDPNMRIGLCTARATDELTVTWGQFSTPIVAMPGTPRIAVLLIDQHLKDMYTAINSLEDNYQKNAFVTVGQGVADYVTDGTADDVQINQAITAVSAAGGGIVYLKKGTYNTTASIVMASNVRLVGAGIGATNIVGAASNYSLINTAKVGTTKTVYSNMTVKELSLKSNYGSCLVFYNATRIHVSEIETTFLATPQIRQAIFFTHCNRVYIDSNTVHDYAGNGISVTATDNFFITRNSIVTGRDDAIDVDFDFLDTSAIASNHGTVVGNVISGVTNGTGIRVENSNYVTVVANEVSNITNDVGSIGGILVNTSLSNTGKFITVADNVLTNCVSSGIQSMGANLTHVSFTSNLLENCGQAGGVNQRGGIVLGSPGVLCTDNTISGTTKVGTDGAALLVYKQDGHLIRNNFIKNSVTGFAAWNGDSLQSYISTTVAGNYFSGNTTNYVIAALAGRSSFKENYGARADRSVILGRVDADFVINGTNDTTQLQAALDAVNTAGGGQVILQAGTITIASMITLYKNIGLIGAGLDKTKVAITASFASGVMMRDNSGDADNIEVTGITFDASGKTNVGYLHIYQGDNVNVHDNRFTGSSCSDPNSKWGVRLGHYVNGTGDDVQSRNVRYCNNLMDNTTCGTFEQLLFVNQRKGFVQNNVWRNNTNSLAYELMLYVNNVDVDVSGNVFEDPSAHSIGVMESKRCDIHHNKFYYDSSFNSVTVINSRNISIERNTGENDNVSNTSMFVHIFDRALGPDGFTQIVEDSKSVTVRDNDVTGYKHLISSQIVGNVSGSDYTMGIQGLVIEGNNVWDCRSVPVILGADNAANLMKKVFIRHNNFYSWVAGTSGAIQLRGYTTDVSQMADIVVKGNYVAPASDGGTGGAVRAIACTVKEVAYNNFEGVSGNGISTATGGVITKRRFNTGTTDADGLTATQTPASATAPGTTGQIVWDANYIYVCTATDTWKRSAISGW